MCDRKKKGRKEKTLLRDDHPGCARRADTQTRTWVNTATRRLLCGGIRGCAFDIPAPRTRAGAGDPRLAAISVTSGSAAPCAERGKSRRRGSCHPAPPLPVSAITARAGSHGCPARPAPAVIPAVKCTALREGGAGCGGAGAGLPVLREATNSAPCPETGTLPAARSGLLSL